MENATKALIFAASSLIAIMILSLMVYIFKSFGNTAKTIDEKMAINEIDAFNSKFMDYDTNGSESITITHVSNGGQDVSKTFELEKIFKNEDKSSYIKDYYKALIGVSQSLNTAVDVVTAVNDAINVNDKNNMGYIYNDGKLEIQNSVEVIIDLNGFEDEFKTIKGDEKKYKYLIIEPNKNVKSKCIYGSNSVPSEIADNTQNKIQNVENKYKDIFDDDNAISVYKFLEMFRDTKVIPKSDETGLDREYIIYKYYFTCHVYYNELTNLIETLKFKLVENKNFINL